MQIGRYVTQKVVENRELGIEYQTLNFEEKDFDEVLGFDGIYEEKDKTHQGPGVVAGLVWTPFGGDLLFIESAAMPGSGRLMLTGKLGEVMRESAELAVSLLKSRMAFWKVNFDFQKTDLHIHAPAGAIPKDGPSAGVTIITSLASLLTGVELADDKAMTGEITLTGAVLPVGGIKEKLMAAHRRGRKKILIPAANEKDLQQLPPEVKSDLDVKLVSHVDEVLEWALGLKFLTGVGYQASLLVARGKPHSEKVI
jgi:ATP-dependent Lon protease